MQEQLARVISNGIYRLSPQSQPDKCLGTYTDGTKTSVQLFSGNCNSANQKWNVTWLGDGTYRFSSQDAINTALAAYNTTASVGGVQIYSWSGDDNQEWVLSSQGNSLFRVGPRLAWSRVLTIDNTLNVSILNYTGEHSQFRTLSNVL